LDASREEVLDLDSPELAKEWAQTSLGQC
jgi:hypothetical protein